MKSIFVSSTFKDMQYERDLLNKYIVPQIREIARSYQKDLHFTDLRWGVNTEKLESNEGARKVLEVCFDEILKCNPYMIVFVGERYGWIPSEEIISEATKNYNIVAPEQISVTELEIQFGALQQNDLDHCIFCFRDKMKSENLSEEQKKIYLAEDEEHEKKLELLKKKILERNPKHIIHYTGEIQNNGEMKISENLEKELVDILSQKMQEEWGNIQDKTWQEKELETAKFFINEKNAKFIGREELVQKYINKIKDKEEYFFILQGESGSGKSSILSKMYEELIQDDTLDVFPFICANSERSVTATDLMNQLNYFIATKIQGVNIEEIEADRFDTAKDIYINLMKKYNKEVNRTLIILVDALNDIFPNKISLEYEWVLPIQNQVILATMTEDMPLPQKQKFGLEKLPLLENLEEKKVIKAICERNHKELSETVINEIVKLKNANNPLYLQMIIQRLMMMDENDFADIRKSGDNMEAINKVQINLIKNIPSYLPGICEFILNSACKHIGTTVAKEALSLIALIKGGLTRKEIQEILEQNQYDWNELQFAALIRYMRICFVEKANGRIDFSHDSIRDGFLMAIKEKDREKYNQMLYDYMEKIDMTEPLKYDNYVEYAFLTCNMDKVIKCAHEQVKQNKILEASFLATGIKKVMDSSHKVHIDYIDTIIENSLETKDVHFIEIFLIEMLKQLFCETENQVKLMQMILEFTLDYIELHEVFETKEDEEYIVSKLTMNLAIIEGRLGNTDKALLWVNKFIDNIDNVKYDNIEKIKDKILLYKELSDSQYENQEYKEGIVILSQTVELAENLYWMDKSKDSLFLVAQLYTNLATKFQGILEREASRENYNLAEQRYKEILETHKDELTNEELIEIKNRIIEVKMNVGDLYVSDRKYEIAEQILKETLEENKKNVEENCNPLAELFYCNNYAKLGYLYCFTNPQLANENYDKCLEMLDLLEIKYPKYQRFCKSVREDVEATKKSKLKEFDIKNIYIQIMKLELLVKKSEEPRYKEELITKYEQLLSISNKREILKISNKILDLYLQLKEQTKDKKYDIGLAEYYTKIGVTYFEKRRRKLAKQYLEMGYELVIEDHTNLKIKSNKQFEVLFINTSYLGKILYKQRKYMEAFDIYFEKYIALLNMSEEMNDEYLEAESNECLLNEMIKSLMKAKEYAEAMKYIESFIDLTIDDGHEESIHKRYIANIWYGKCAKKLNQPDKIKEMNLKLYGKEE